MKSATAPYWKPSTPAPRRRYRAVVRMRSGHLLIARGVYSGMLEAESSVSRWIVLLNHLYPGTRLQVIRRIKNGTS